MKWNQSITNKHHTYNNYDITVAYKSEFKEWFVASDIQEAYREKYGKFVSLSKIGRVAKKFGLVKEVKGCGFKLYHISLVDLL